MPLKIERNDLTKMKVDAVVNAANCGLAEGGGVCGAIFAAAGRDKLRAACNALGGCHTGSAVITPGFNLPAKYIIHTPGPIWKGGNNGEREQLYSCYQSSLALAVKKGCKSIAFPLISSGIFGYPKDKALEVAVSSIGAFLLNNEEIDVYLTVFDSASYVLGDKLFSSISSYIDDNYAEAHYRREPMQDYMMSAKLAEKYDAHVCMSAPAASANSRPSLDDAVAHLEDSFSTRLFHIIDKKHMTDVEVYKRANIDRKLFSKIRSDKNYRPGKNTAIALAIALKLNIDEAKDLLAAAGYALSRSSRFDIIIEYFINNNNYDIFEINQALFAFCETTL